MINGYYAGAAVGVSRTFACVSEILVDALVAKPRFDDKSILSYRRKLAYEATFRVRYRKYAARVHPYFAATVDPKAVLFVHDTIGQAGNPDRLHLRAIERAGSIVTVSGDSHRMISEKYNRDAVIFSLYPDDRYFAPIPERGRDGGQPLVGYWAGYSAHKDWQLVSRAAGVGDARVWATGSYPTTDPAVRSVGRLDIPELIRRIDQTDVALCPSRMEGLGLAPYEAALRGVPIVVRRLESYREFMDFDPEGGVFAFETESEFREAVERAVTYGRRREPLAALHRRTLTSARDTCRAQLMRALVQI